MLFFLKNPLIFHLNPIFQSSWIHRSVHMSETFNKIFEATRSVDPDIGEGFHFPRKLNFYFKLFQKRRSPRLTFLQKWPLLKFHWSLAWKTKNFVFRKNFEVELLLLEHLPKYSGWHWNLTVSKWTLDSRVKSKNIFIPENVHTYNHTLTSPNDSKGFSKEHDWSNTMHRFSLDYLWKKSTQKSCTCATIS